MVKEHSDSESGNLPSLHGLLFVISSKVGFVMHYVTAFVTPVMEHWLERELVQWVNHEGLI